MNEFYTRITQTSDKTRYEITFSTDDRRYFDKVEEACRACIDEPAIKAIPLDKTFDIVDAFMHLIWGRKVRMRYWNKDEYIKLADDTGNGDDVFLVNEKNECYPAENLFRKCLIKGEWEEFKEENENE